MAFFVNPGLIVRTHHVHVHAFAFNLRDGVVFDGEVNAVSQIAFESEVHITWRHHQSAIHTTSSRECQSQTTWPVRDHARFGTKAPYAAYHRGLQLNVEIRSGFGSHMHVLRTAQFFHGIAHNAFKRRIGHSAFQNFRVLVGNHEQARHDAVGAFQNSGQFRRMQHAFYRAINHHIGTLQSSHHGGQVLNDIGSPSRSNWGRCAQCRCRQADFKDLSTHALECESCQINIDTP